ncbi:unnamed protein product [Brassica napus]|uniref:(rape) hypothetical protein n=1 Tax=Brassica napus TaxID=3708 RepID=A0A816VYZ9_BRANA|nr:unnamed protein product [Brassica napus]
MCYSLMISYIRGIVEAAETLKGVEDLDIEQERKIINRPAVKIIKRPTCVPVYTETRSVGFHLLGLASRNGFGLGTTTTCRNPSTAMKITFYFSVSIRSDRRKR